MEFDTNFDYHVEEQQKAHLQEYDSAKYHGKGKTKQCRLAPLFHHDALRLAPHNDWPSQVDANAKRVSHHLEIILGTIDTRLATFFAACQVEGPHVSCSSFFAGPAMAKESVRTFMRYFLGCRVRAMQELPVASNMKGFFS